MAALTRQQLGAPARPGDPHQEEACLMWGGHIGRGQTTAQLSCGDPAAACRQCVACQSRPTGRPSPRRGPPTRPALAVAAGAGARVVHRQVPHELGAQQVVEHPRRHQQVGPRRGVPRPPRQAQRQDGGGDGVGAPEQQAHRGRQARRLQAARVRHEQRHDGHLRVQGRWVAPGRPCRRGWVCSSDPAVDRRPGPPGGGSATSAVLQACGRLAPTCVTANTQSWVTRVRWKWRLKARCRQEGRAQAKREGVSGGRRGRGRRLQAPLHLCPAPAGALCGSSRRSRWQQLHTTPASRPTGAPPPLPPRTAWLKG